MPSTCSSCGSDNTTGSRFCTSCGTPIPDPTPSLQDLPPPEPSADTRQGRGRRGLVVGALVVLLVAGGGVAAITLLGTPGDAGGAETPEGLVAAFEEAVASNDVMAVARLLPPDELRPLARVYAAAEARARTEGLLAEEAAPLDGVQVTLDGFDPDIEEIDDGLARIELGDFAVSVQTTDAFLPALQELVGQQLTEVDETLQVSDQFTTSRHDPETAQLREVELDGFVMAVQRHGRWYLSPLYTGAQYLVEFRGVDDADMSATPEDPPAAEPPEAALAEYVEAAGDLDTDTLLAGLDSLAGLPAAYADPIDELTDELLDASGLEDVLEDLELDDLEVTTTELDGGLLDVEIEEFSLEIDTTDWSATLDFDGDCFDYRQRFSSGDDHVTESCIPDAFTDLSGLQTWSVKMRRAGDGYVVDPVETVASTLETLLARADSSALFRALELPPLEPDPDQITPGEVAEAVTSPAGTWVGTFDAETDTNYSIVTDGQAHRIAVGGPDATWDWSWGNTRMWRSTTAGTHRVVVNTREWEATEADVVVRPVTVRDHPAGQAIDVELAPGEVRGFRIDPPERGLVVEGERRRVEALDGSIRHCGTEEDPCEETVIIFVGGDLDQDSHRVELSQPPAYGFTAGGFTVSGLVSDGAASEFTARLPSDAQYTVVLEPDPGFDAVLEATSPDGLTGSIDAGLAGDRETLPLSGHPEGVWRFEVSGWLGSGGGFTLRLVRDTDVV